MILILSWVVLIAQVRFGFGAAKNFEFDFDDVTKILENEKRLLCSTFDDDVTSKVEWGLGNSPDDGSPCVVTCTSLNLDVARIVDVEVTNGTKCGREKICLRGKCEPLGCDKESPRICGKCCTHCHLVTGIFLSNNKTEGVDHVVTIPKNCQFVRLSESANGHIGLRTANKDEKSLFDYDVTADFGKWYFEGPLDGSIEVVAVYNDEPWRYIRYEFYRPLAATWKHKEHGSSCSTTCGGGLQFVRPVCVDVETEKETEEKFCGDLTPPAPRVRRCNDFECPPSATTFKRIETSFEFARRNLWVPDPWTSCSADCSGGFQTRIVSCAEETLRGVFFTADPIPCFRIPPPDTWRRCNEDPCPLWFARPWNPCRRMGGVGIQNRIVQCRTPGGEPAHSCDVTNKPVRMRRCGRDHARILFQHAPAVISVSTDPSWVPGSWGECSRTCGSGTTTREVTCKKINQSTGTVDVLDDVICVEEKPATSQACSMGSCFDYDVTDLDYDVTGDDYDDEVYEGSGNYEFLASSEFGWKFANFSSCAPPCGNGTRTSTVLCRHKATNAIASPDHCDVTARPEDRIEKCFGGPCHVVEKGENDTKWDLTPYRDCNATCGRGLQVRSVVCRQMPEGGDYFDSSARVKGRRMPEMMCPAPKPKARMACSQVACSPKWAPQLWGKCSKTCGRGIQTRKLRCFQKLGTGQTKEVPNYFCPKLVPETRRVCNFRPCPSKYSAGEWSECHVTCGKGFQTRSVACVQVLAGKSKPRAVPKSKCRRFSRPAAKRSCHAGKCPPFIHTSEDVLIQKKKRAKIQLQVGNTAYILPRTTVIVKCRVERLNKELIRWEFNGARIANRRISVMPDGSLRLIHARAPDSGSYTCVAGPTRAHFELTVTYNTSGASDARHHAVGVSRTDVPLGGDEEPMSRSSIPPRRLVSMAPRPEQIPRFDPYEISYTEQRPVLLNKGGDYDETKEYKFDDGLRNSGEASELTDLEGYKDFIDQVNSITELSRVDLNNATDSHINDLLELLTESSLTEPENRVREPTFIPAIQSREPSLVPGSNNREPHFVSGIQSKEPSFISGLNNGEPTFIPKNHNLEPTFVPGSNNREPTFVPGSNNREPTFIPGSNNREPTFVPGSYNREPTFVPGSNNREPTFVPGSNNKEPTFVPGSNNREPTFVPGSNNREPTFVPGSNNREPTFVPGSNNREPSFVPGSNNREPTFVSGNHDGNHEAVPGQCARITPHPTRVPLQLDREVNAYVGGSLIVADADKITVLCEATGEPEPTYSWYRDGAKLPLNRRQFILRDGSLRLLYPQTSDSGNYVCVASNRHGNDSQVTSLSVAKVPRILSTTATLENFTSDHVVAVVGSKIRAKLGARVTIRCPTEGSPDPFVIWYKDGPGLRQNSKLLSDNSIEVFPTTAADQGLFGCEASNPAGTDYQASSLVLIDPPRISEELNVVPNIEGVVGLPELLLTALTPEYYKIKVNSSVMMGCPVTGFPDPEINWYFNGELLADTESIDYQLLQNDKVLQLANAELATRGFYSCVASNEGGSVNTSLSLDLIVYSYGDGGLTECSASCGGSGTNYVDMVCLEDGARVVDEWYCIGIEKPLVVIQPCNRVDCPPRFVPGSWSQCSVSCGNGTRNRDVACSILMSDGSAREVTSEGCDDVMPSRAESCFEGSCPRWELGRWRSCTRRCVGRGVGVKTRKVSCVSANGSQVVPRSNCRHLPRPKRRSYCPNRRCEPVWMASAWSVCSGSCGSTGIRTRILNCVYRGRRRQSAGNQCNDRRRPPVSTPCSGRSCTHETSTPKPPTDRRRTSCASKSRCLLIKRRKLCRFYRNVCCKICRR